MGKRSKSRSIADEGLVVKSKRVKNDTKIIEDNVTSDESKPDESTTTPKDKKLITKIKKVSHINKINNGKRNKKIIFNDDNDEAVEVENPPVQHKRISNKVELPQENEEDVKDEDIDKFCNEINEEDNEQYENWVKLIEEKLHSNKKKPK